MALWLRLVFLALATLVAVYAAHRALRWMARRGWGQYGKRRFRSTSDSSGGGGMAGVLNSFQQFVEPEIRYVMEEKDQRKAAAGDEASPADR
jgi:hypothetical protein